MAFKPNFGGGLNPNGDPSQTYTWHPWIEYGKARRTYEDATAPDSIVEITPDPWGKGGYSPEEQQRAVANPPMTPDQYGEQQGQPGLEKPENVIIGEPVKAHVHNTTPPNYWKGSGIKQTYELKIDNESGKRWISPTFSEDRQALPMAQTDVPNEPYMWARSGFFETPPPTWPGDPKEPSDPMGPPSPAPPPAPPNNSMAPGGQSTLNWPGQDQGATQPVMPPSNGAYPDPEIGGSNYNDNQGYTDPTAYSDSSAYQPQQNPDGLQSMNPQMDYALPNGQRLSDTPQDSEGWIYGDTEASGMPARERQPYYDPYTDPNYLPEGGGWYGNNNRSPNQLSAYSDHINNRGNVDNESYRSHDPSDASFYYPPDAAFDPNTGTFTPYPDAAQPMPNSVPNPYAASSSWNPFFHPGF